MGVQRGGVRHIYTGRAESQTAEIMKCGFTHNPEDCARQWPCFFVLEALWNDLKTRMTNSRVHTSSDAQQPPQIQSSLNIVKYARSGFLLCMICIKLCSHIDTSHLNTPNFFFIKIQHSHLANPTDPLTGQLKEKFVWFTLQLTSKSIYDCPIGHLLFRKHKSNGQSMLIPHKGADWPEGQCLCVHLTSLSFRPLLIPGEHVQCVPCVTQSCS